MEFVNLKAQYAALKTHIDARIQCVLDHGHYIMGPEVAELEEKLCTWTGSKACITCSSGTDALVLALMALGVRAGDEIITTPFSFVATAEAIALLGARPVFVDIDSRTFNMDHTQLDRAITQWTKAIIPVSLFGQCAEMDEINRIANQHGIAVIEDAAQSFGATYRGRSSCNLSTIACTRLFPSKPLGCYGDGGACFTNDDEMATRLRQLRVHGQERRYNHTLVGINGRLDTLQAAILLAKLDYFKYEIEARSCLAERYNELLGETVTIPYIESFNTSVFAQYTIQIDDRHEIQQTLKAAAIPTAVHYPLPLHLQPAFMSAGFSRGSLPHAEAASERVLSLPMHPYLTGTEQSRIADVLKLAVVNCFSIKEMV